MKYFCFICIITACNTDVIKKWFNHFNGCFEISQGNNIVSLSGQPLKWLIRKKLFKIYFSVYITSLYLLLNS